MAMSAKGIAHPTGTRRRWTTRRGALAVSLVCACIALALSLPHGVTLVRGATRADDIYLTWPLLTMNGPSIEHAYLGLAVIALLLAALFLRPGSQPAAQRRAAIVTCCVASVPLVVAIARLLFDLCTFMQLTAP
jgi:hypothetical protein